MSDCVPNLRADACPATNGRLGFLTPEEAKIASTAEDLAVWVSEGFHAIDFPFPKGLNIDCSTARDILIRAGLQRTKKLDS